MIEGSLHALPSADELARGARHRMMRLALIDILIAAAVGIAYTAFGLDTPILPLVLLLCLLTPFILWRWPSMSLYTIFASVCLFEMLFVGSPDSLTDRVPFFWNFNTIMQTYGHTDFKAIPLNLMEMFILLAGTCSLIRSVYTRTTNLRVGSLFWPIAIYIVFVMGAWAVGMATGGDFKISLQEVRSQIYFLIAYLIAVNVIRRREQTTTLLWIMVWCIGLKGVLYTVRKYVTMAGLPIPDQGVGSHEEAFFFNCFICLLLSLAITNTHKRLQTVMWVLMPIVLVGDLVCNRRAATAAIVIVIPMLFMAAYKALPERRRLIATLSIVMSVSGLLYYNTYKNSGALIAKPARAIHSQFAPDARDASSNAYRDAEDADLYATIKSSPIIGYGYGKRMIHAVPIADISINYDWWDILTHDQILWVWMRVGTVGFIAFWMMISAILIRACLTIRSDTADNEIKGIAIFVIMVVGMLMIFGLLDLQLSCFRDMLFTGFVTGVLAALPGFAIRLAAGPEPASNNTTPFRRRPSSFKRAPVPISSDDTPVLDSPTLPAGSPV